MSNPDREFPQGRQGARRVRAGSGRRSASKALKGLKVLKDPKTQKAAAHSGLLEAPVPSGAIRKARFYLRYIQRREKRTDERLTNLERELSLMNKFGSLTFGTIGEGVPRPDVVTAAILRDPREPLTGDHVARNDSLGFVAIERRQPPRRRTLSGPLDPSRMTLEFTDPDEQAEQGREEIHTRLGVRPRTRP
ncbi:hypothetical protein [Burkholderia ubonensis]|uniref:Uncharacterized protein n=1 Tax=Burkholderia ubonensis subsp. mesacidophila TaxID=265293 RepID=A0A2A4FAQ6_9BURK|nr:hypothetical protein [Burkholderia ubonensis]PCE30225.1 hypothetical protein BZL54_21265 [Burkholderia ubonensis subsp. mesacidophila]